MQDNTLAPNELPERLVLPLDRAFTFSMWLISVGFVAIGKHFIDHPSWRTVPFMDWAGVVVFFGACAVVFTAEFIKPQIMCLELTRDGFRLVGVFRKATDITPWSDVTKIEVWRYWSPRGLWKYSGVRITYLPGHGRPRLPYPRTFGRSAQALADLMNRFRDRALATTQPPQAIPASRQM